VELVKGWVATSCFLLRGVAEAWRWACAAHVRAWWSQVAMMASACVRIFCVAKETLRHVLGIQGCRDSQSGVG